METQVSYLEIAVKLGQVFSKLSDRELQYLLDYIEFLEQRVKSGTLEDSIQSSKT